MMDAFIYDGQRTGFGRHGGSLSSVRPDDLMATVLRSVMMRQAIDGQAIEDVIVGNTNQSGEDCRNVARFAALLADLPVSAAGITVNRLCGSGLAACADAARAIRCNEGDAFLAGGVESMSRAPLVMSKADRAFSRNQTLVDSTIGARFSNPRFIEAFGNHAMAETADLVASQMGISREQCDNFALASQRKYLAAQQQGFFVNEITAVTVASRKKGEVNCVDQDEHPRPDTQPEQLAGLRPLYPNGVVTAGNASGINDGAAALLLGSETLAKKGLTPRARILSSAVSGVEPQVMGLGPVEASRKALQRAGLTLQEMDVIEINEAFAAQVLGCLRALELDADDPRLNPNGGAIALGHPLGASGARLLLTAVNQLHTHTLDKALVSLCIGLGQGIAMVIERV